MTPPDTLTKGRIGLIDAVKLAVDSFEARSHD
jgi:hypothetical protein